MSSSIEVSVGDHAQPTREIWEITERKVYTYGLNSTFNDKVAEIPTPTPVTVDLKITDKTGNQLHRVQDDPDAADKLLRLDPRRNGYEDV